MDVANKEVINEAVSRRLTDIVKVYMHQDDRQAIHWVKLLMSLPQFSAYFYRTHLMLGEMSLYRTTAREKGDLPRPVPMDWYVDVERDTGRMEDVLDQRVYLANGVVTEPVLGIDIKFKRILTEDGKVYELHSRQQPVKVATQKKTAALLRSC